MKSVVHAVLCLSIVATTAAFAATPAPATSATSTAPNAAHVGAIQNLLAAMQIENVLRGVAGRSRYQSAAQRQAVFAKIDRVPPGEIYRRLAPALVASISADTAIEMTRFYTTPYGKNVIQKKYNSSAQIIMPGMQTAISPEEKKERKRPAYVKASKELEAAQPAIEHEAFKLLQAIDKEKR
jgi:hypothetical protein